MLYEIDKRLNTIRSQKRPFAKWVKPEKSDNLECIKHVYNFSDTKAREAMNLLSEKQIQELKKQTDKGGLGK